MSYTGSNPPNVPKNTQQPAAVAIIPARYDSVRLPGKALLEISGKPMICWVVERALTARSVGRAIVATDDERIFRAVQDCGHEAVMTNAAHRSGTDRIAEVAQTLDAEIIVNVQGDEPQIAPETIDLAVDALEKEMNGGDAEIGIATTWEPIETAEDVLSPDVVKIVVDENRNAVYFSRSPVPYPRQAVNQHGSLKQALKNESSLLARFRKHTGLYVYRREVLLAYASWPQTELERTESLEQLRALEHGVRIKAVRAAYPSVGVDTADDLARVRAMFAQERVRSSAEDRRVHSTRSARAEVAL